MTKAAVATAGLLFLLGLGFAGSSAFLRSPAPPLKTVGGEPSRILRREGLCLPQPPVWAGRDGERFGDLFELGRELGRGGFGTVHLATHRISKRTFAAKTIAIPTPAMRAMALKEVETMVALGDHPNIVKLHPPAFEEESNVTLVMDLCEGGDLQEFCESVSTDWETGKRTWVHGNVSFEVTERVIASIAQQMVSGIAHMHSRGVAHRDIKMDNFMLARAPGPDGKVEVMICDFGVSCAYRLADGRTAEVERVGFGFKDYFSPEMIGAGHIISFCPTQSDMWAAGVVCYRLLCSAMPFRNWEGFDLYDKIRTSALYFPDVMHLSSQAKSFVSALIERNLPKRLDAPGVMIHPWIQGLAVQACLTPAV